MPKRKRAKAKARREAAAFVAETFRAHVNGLLKVLFAGMPEMAPRWPQDAPRRVRPLSTP